MTCSGIYLACILYHEDKILVTNEDFLPVIEIDETYPSNLHIDYHWFMKVRIIHIYHIKSIQSNAYEISMARIPNPINGYLALWIPIQTICSIIMLACCFSMNNRYRFPVRGKMLRHFEPTWNAIKRASHTFVRNYWRQPVKCNRHYVYRTWVYCIISLSVTRMERSL